jgi:hypothetical protein
MLFAGPSWVSDPSDVAVAPRLRDDAAVDASSNAKGDPPFRIQMMIGHPNAASLEASDAEIATMVQ